MFVYVLGSNGVLESYRGPNGNIPNGVGTSYAPHQVRRIFDSSKFQVMYIWPDIFFHVMYWTNIHQFKEKMYVVLRWGWQVDSYN